MVTRPIINLATKYADSVRGLGVRTWTRPTSLEGLKLAPNAAFDSFSSSLKKSFPTFLSADAKLFLGTKQKPALTMNKIEPESLVMVHRTKYFPQNGKILSTSEATRQLSGVSEYRPTLHTALNKSVTEHAFGNAWDTMEYSIIMPFKETVSSLPKSKVIGGIQDDFFLMDSVKLPKGSVILKHSSNIPKEQLKITEVFDGVKLIETSSDDMVAATDLVIKKMGYTPYNEALQKYLGATAEEVKLITSMPETELIETYQRIGADLASSRSQIKESMKIIDDMKDIYPPDVYQNIKESCIKNLKHCDIAEKYTQKLREFPKAWQKFCDSQSFYQGLHDGTAWAESEKVFIGLDYLSKGSKDSWVWGSTDYKAKLLEKLQDCKSKLLKDKEIGYDFDKVMSIIKNSDTPELAEKEIIKQLKIKGMKPANRSEQFKKMGLDEKTIAEFSSAQNEAPEEFVLEILLNGL